MEIWQSLASGRVAVHQPLVSSGDSEPMISKTHPVEERLPGRRAAPKTFQADEVKAQELHVRKPGQQQRGCNRAAQGDGTSPQGHVVAPSIYNCVGHTVNSKAHLPFESSAMLGDWAGKSGAPRCV